MNEWMKHLNEFTFLVLNETFLKAFTEFYLDKKNHCYYYNQYST